MPSLRHCLSPCLLYRPNLHLGHCLRYRLEFCCVTFAVSLSLPLPPLSAQSAPWPLPSLLPRIVLSHLCRQPACVLFTVTTFKPKKRRDPTWSHSRTRCLLDNPCGHRLVTNENVADTCFNPFVAWTTRECRIRSSTKEAKCFLVSIQHVKLYIYRL